MKITSFLFLTFFMAYTQLFAAPLKLIGSCQSIKLPNEAGPDASMCHQYEVEAAYADMSLQMAQETCSSLGGTWAMGKVCPTENAVFSEAGSAQSEAFNLLAYFYNTSEEYLERIGQERENSEEEQDDTLIFE